VVLPGTARSQRADPRPPTTPAASAPFRLLCIGSVTPRKGHLDLVEALAACLARNPRLPWRLVCIGSLERDAACAAALRARISALGLSDRVCLAGERDEADVDRSYAEADAFVLASHHEGYGMVLAEALAHGLPIVSTTAGAIPQTVPAGAGILVPPGDVGALSLALERVMAGDAVRDEMAASARRAAADLPDWDTAAGRFLGVLQSLAAVR
jgi:glycosyltransferase involved in cell wall biosynthesis